MQTTVREGGCKDSETKSYVIIVCRRFADGRLRFWNAGWRGHEDGTGGVVGNDCECAAGAFVREERFDADDGCGALAGEAVLPRPAGSSLGVRRWCVRDEPSEWRLLASDPGPRVGEELWERCPEPWRGPYCWSMNGGVGGSSGMSV